MKLGNAVAKKQPLIYKTPTKDTGINQCNQRGKTSAKHDVDKLIYPVQKFNTIKPVWIMISHEKTLA